MEELRDGKTIEKKKEEECPFFARLDALFGGRANVTPANVMEGGYPELFSSAELSVIATMDEEDDDDGDDEEDDDEEEADDDEEEANDEEEADDDEEDEDIETVRTPSLAFSSLDAVVTSPAVVTLPVVPLVAKTVKVTKKKAVKDSSILTSSSTSGISAAVLSSCDAAVVDAEGNVTKGKGKKDFGTCYAESRTEEFGIMRGEIELKKQIFEHEKLIANKKMELEIKKANDNDATKTAITLQLIQSGKTPAETVEYLTALKLY